MTASKVKVRSKGQIYIHAHTHTLSVPPTKRSRHLAWLDHLCPSPPLVVLASLALRNPQNFFFLFSANILKSNIVCLYRLQIFSVELWRSLFVCLCFFFSFSVNVWGSVHSVFCMFSVFFKICTKCILIGKEPVCRRKPVALSSS